MAKDIYHEAVREALIKDGWTITHDPFILKLGGRDSVEIDLGAEKMLVAERANQRIIVEVKSFLNRSLIYDFHQAYGQFGFYLKALRKFHPDRILFLAMPEDIFGEFMDKPYYRDFIREEMRLMVFNPIEKIVTAWINDLDTEK